MILISKLIAIALIMLGCGVLLKKGLLQKIANYVKVDSRVYVIAVARIIIGVIFIIASFVGTAGWIVPVLGWLIIISGVFVFVIKKEKALEIVDKVLAHPSAKMQRLIATVPIVIGVLVLCSL